VYDEVRYSRIAAARQAEQRSMLDYETTTECRMTFLQRALDDVGAEPCGRCDRCAGAWYPSEVASGAAASVATALDRVGVEIEPRKLWPTGADRLGVPVRGKISPEEILAPGRALARLTDLGWGGPLRDLLSADAGDQPIPPQVLAACIRVLADWDWSERPAAVVSMPSRRRPEFVSSLARGFAEAGRLPYLGALESLAGGPMGEPGGNSAFRLSSVWERFGVGGLQIPVGQPILLVDDMVDSRWSITVAGRELRRAGASAVLPFAAALRS
jgi:ATP-dependent DNA helicase RecQ